MKQPKNKLDERQELELLRIESRGFWLAFWGIFALVLFQCLMVRDWIGILSSFLVLLVVCVYIVGACLRAGLWDRRLKPNLKTNLVVSGLAALVVLAFVAGLMGIRGYLIQFPVISVFSGLLSGAVTFALSLAALQLCARLYRKRVKEQEQMDESDEKGEEA